MLLNEQTVDLEVRIDIEDPVIKINIKEIPIIPFYEVSSVIMLEIKEFNYINMLLNINNLSYSDIDNIPGIYRGIINRPFIFNKIISGRKTTFGRAALIITNNFITISNYDNSYGYGVYGAGVYPAGVGAFTYNGAIVFPITFTKAVSGRKTTFGQISSVIGFGSTISGITLLKQTTVAEISLSSHATPSTRINHAIKVRARTLTGSGGVIKAALYEGTTNRSGNLISGTLTNVLTDYTLVIPESVAATITNYNNLSIKVWGYNASGTGLTFEIAKVYLEIPA